MTKMLDLLDAYLEGEGHQTCRIDGSVSWQDRQEAIRSFTRTCRWVPLHCLLSQCCWDLGWLHVFF